LARHTLKQVRSVNALAPTKMCRVMVEYGSDKGKGWYNCTTVYSVLCKACRDQPLRIFELGLGTNNPALPSSMGVYGRPGASLRGWRELFPNAFVYGATSIVLFCFRTIGSRRFTATSLTNQPSVISGRSRIYKVACISSSRMVSIPLRQVFPSWKDHSITYVRVVLT
jgi:hypothetical protein